MDNIFYPPHINEKLPAQKGNIINIPFLNSRAAGEPQHLKLQIKTISTNTLKIVLDSKEIIWQQGNLYKAVFELPESLLNIGQYYKAQLAYSQNDDIGEYSTVGIFKYTIIPNLSILDMNKGIFNTDSPIGTFIGVYKNINGNENDITEKVSEYKFDIYEDDKLFYSTGFLIHDSQNDTNEYESTDIFITQKEFSYGKIYTINYTVKTNNDLIETSKDYSFIKKPNIRVKFPCGLKLYTDQLYDNSLIKISLYGKEKGILFGNYRLVRASDKDNFKTWDILQKIEFRKQDINLNQEIEIFQDYLLEQGITYKYALQQEWGNNILSRPLYSDIINNGEKNIISNIIYCDYEDMFLYDGKRQLKIRYNPKVSSFKNDILENKIDTLGGQYPYFFRNGYTKYKEFPISGLISYLIDDNHLFIKKENIFSNNAEQFKEERNFKLEVLNWLTNGKPKLFKSPSEGIYIVKLLNTSLFPIDTISRMLHSFQSTAYECDKCNFESMVKNHLLDTKLLFISPQLYDNQILKGTLIENNSYIIKKIDIPNAVQCKIIAPPFSSWVITYGNKEQINIKIGLTGIYDIPINENNPIINLEGKCSLQYAEDANNIGSIEYSYREFSYYDQDSSFHKKLDGVDDSIMKCKIINTFEEFVGGQANNIITLLTEDNHDLEMINFIKIKKKLSQQIYEKNNHFYLDKYCQHDLHDYWLNTNNYYFIKNNIVYWLNDQQQATEQAPDYSYKIDNKKFILASGYINITSDDYDEDYLPTEFSIGNGLIAEINYFYSVKGVQ